MILSVNAKIINNYYHHLSDRQCFLMTASTSIMTLSSMCNVIMASSRVLLRFVVEVSSISTIVN